MTEHTTSVAPDASRLTPEQEAAVAAIYPYKVDGEIKEGDLNLLSALLPTTEHIHVLSKVLGMLTREQAGIHFESPEEKISAATDEELGRELRVQRAVESRIRLAMQQLFILIRKHGQKTATESFAERNRKNAETQAQADINSQQFGENV